MRTDWAEAVTVRRGPNRQIGVQFSLSCPDDLLLAGTVGIDMLPIFSAQDRIESLDDAGS